MDEGGEALSPLLACKAAHLHAAALASHAAALAAAAPAAPAPLPGSGSVGGTPPPLAPAALDAGDGTMPADATGAAQSLANGVVKRLTSREGLAAAAGGATGCRQGTASPVDLSTMAVDLAPPANGADHPQPSASFQPSGLPPAAAVAAALAALEQQQAALNGGLPHTPPQVPAELGELYQALQQQVGSGTQAALTQNQGVKARGCAATHGVVRHSCLHTQRRAGVPLLARSRALVGL